MGKGICRECGAEMTWTRKPKFFCSSACRQEHTNRRRDRGAQMYDLFMALRYDRQNAKGKEVWTKLCRLAEKFHDDDLVQGRESTIPLERVLEQHSYLAAQTLVKVRQAPVRK